jgi:RNA polymerase sigma-70 factor (ECF subfamily)
VIGGGRAGSYAAGVAEPHPAQPQPRTDMAERFVAEMPALITWLCMRAARLCGQRVDVEDLAQEVWLRAVQNAARYDAQRAGYRTWLFGIAANVLLEARRDDRRRARVQIDDGRSSVLERRHEVPAEITSVTVRVARGEALARLVATLAGRDEIDRRVFQLRGLEQRPHADVAQLVGISAEAATKRWHRLRGDLREMLERLGLSAE